MPPFPAEGNKGKERPKASDRQRGGYREPPELAEGFFWQQNGARRLYAADALFGVGAILNDAQNAQVTKGKERPK